VRRRRVALALSTMTLLVCLACGERSAPAPAFVDLGGDAARVGNVAIPVSLVATVVRARGVAKREALAGLVEDALWAQAARDGRLDREPSVGWASTAMLARLVPERLGNEARARGAPSDDELATVRVVHAVVLRSPTLPTARASAIAEAIRQAVAGARDDEDFETLANQVLHAGARLTVERVPEFDAGGRTPEGAEVDPIFVAAAFALRSHGETTGIVETPFGWHVIRLLQRQAPGAERVERRRQELAEAVLGMRARAQLSATLQAQRRRQPVEVSAGADELMAEAVASAP
jgi:PPIC-type peptidyl-prolyl cis-trans isomerase-like protein